ncbi:nuclear transport factor 2 family protein [Paracoccus sp. (in: a-proteobacteria)]|uniref:nuclear transport factor 2 family protein n=1 Tax=Paracoccus sp. TaxID=267 RepID=UPI0026E06804|nr:nuclear transport factor 2 family protein [Paracoccus sp. (in: a-proteobacteria)]MDO5647712.1 nuclear transport factor 2 family protein [Paracoccus sp. (in: a-proteobacteria)]
MTPAQIVTGYWDAMRSNDFARAADWLAPDVEIIWPQSGELIRGRADFAALNHAYPGGPWRFDVQTLIADGAQVVTDTVVSDGQMTARAVTFHHVENGLIARQREYWPDDTPAPDWRRAWVSRV